MKTVYCVTSGLPGVKENPNRKLLEEACRTRDVRFVELPVPRDGFTMDDVPSLNEEGGIYLLNIQPACFHYVYALQRKNPHLNTLYRDTYSSFTPWDELMLNELAGVPIIPTLYCPSATATLGLLQAIREQLGGFPVVFKKSGGSHGSDVMVIDSEISLKTLLPHLVEPRANTAVVFKRFVASATHYRIIVVNDRVVGSIKYLPQPQDIRTNAVQKPSVEAVKVSEEIAAMSVKAVANKGVYFGGVDILVDEDEKAYLAEVNTPCNFSRNQHLTGDDVAGALVDFLTR